MKTCILIQPKIKQFADDTTLTMNDENDMKLAVSIVEQFSRIFRSKIKQSQIGRHLDGLKKT